MRDAHAGFARALVRTFHSQISSLKDEKAGEVDPKNIFLDEVKL